MAETDKALAAKTLESALKKLSPEHIKALPSETVQAFGRGETCFAEMLGLNGKEMLEMALHGYQCYEQGKYEDSKQIFLGLCELDPLEPYYRQALGATLLAMGDIEGALERLTQSLKLDKDNPMTLVNRGELLLRVGRVEEAAADLKRVVDLDPETKLDATRHARALAAAVVRTLDQAAQADAAAKPAAAPKTAPPAAKVKKK